MIRWIVPGWVLVSAVASAAPLPPAEVTPDPQYEAPAYSQPAPSYGQPAPSYGQPAPSYGQPAYGQPAYGQPAYGQPYPGYYYGYGCTQPTYCQSACTPPPCCSGYGCATGHAAQAGGWRMVIGDDGAWYREREVKKGNPGLVAAGLVLWLGSWLGTGWGGTMQDGYVGGIAFVPFLGPFISASIQGADNHGESAALYTVAGLTQVTGFILFVAGAASKRMVKERQRVSFGAAPTQTGFAANLSLRF